MTGDEGPRLTYLGTVESGANIIFVPRETLKAADARLAAERLKRALDAEKEALRVLQAARKQSRLRRALHALGFRGRRR